MSSVPWASNSRTSASKSDRPINAASTSTVNKSPLCNSSRSKSTSSSAAKAVLSPILPWVVNCALTPPVIPVSTAVAKVSLPSVAAKSAAARVSVCSKVGTKNTVPVTELISNNPCSLPDTMLKLSGLPSKSSATIPPTKPNPVFSSINPLASKISGALSLTFSRSINTACVSTNVPSSTWINSPS